MIYWLLNLSTNASLLSRNKVNIFQTELNAAVFLLEHIYAIFIILMREEETQGTWVG